MSTWYIVQLQLEMFCIGPKCNFGTLVRLSSTRGAVIFKMKRDDEYILMMLERFKIFYSKYVLTKTVPPPNSQTLLSEGQVSWPNSPGPGTV